MNRKHKVVVVGKFFLLFVLLCLVAAQLTACDTMPFTAREPVTIKFIYLQNSAPYEPLAEAFTRQNPHIKIELIEAGQNLYRDFGSTTESADVVRLHSSFMADRLSNNEDFLPLDTFISLDPNFPQADFVPNTLQGLQMNGKQLAVPAGLAPYVFFYNPQKFTAAGIEPPGPGWTLQDFLMAAIAINNHAENAAGSPTFAYGYCTHITGFDPVILMYLLGGGLTDDIYQPTRPMLNQPANLDAVQWYFNLGSEFMLTPKAINTSEIGQMVAGGQCGFWMNSLEPMSLGGLAPGMAAPLPLPVAEAPFSVITEEGYVILANSQHPDEAWKWIGFLLQQESASGAVIPPLKTSIESAEYRGRVSPQVLDVARSLYGDNVVLSLELQRNERMGRTLDLFYRALQETAQGNSDLQSALDAAQESALRAFP